MEDNMTITSPIFRNLLGQLLTKLICKKIGIPVTIQFTGPITMKESSMSASHILEGAFSIEISDSNIKKLITSIL